MHVRRRGSQSSSTDQLQHVPCTIDRITRRRIALSLPGSLGSKAERSNRSLFVMAFREEWASEDPKRLEDARRATHPCLSSARERNLASGRNRDANREPEVSRILLGEETRGRNEKRLGIVEVVAKHQTVCLIRDDPRADTCRRFLPPFHLPRPLGERWTFSLFQRVRRSLSCRG